LEINWADLLNGFGGQLNPLHESLFEHYQTDYYWTCYQSEWATDIVFAEAGFLRRLMPLLVRHGVLSFSSADVMRYFGKKVNQSGDVPASFNGTLETDLKRRQQGERVKYRMNGNSAKFYDKAYSEWGSVLRGSETTINDVEDFRVYRTIEGGPEDDQRVLNALAGVDDSRSVEELTADIQKQVQWSNRKVRGLRPWAEDKELLTAINQGDFLINGFRNRDLQKALYASEAQSKADQRRRSSATSRKLRLLRAHGLIQKVPRTHRYQVTDCGRTILIAVLTVARTSVHQLNQLLKAA
jgi:hypothetical protein